MAQKTVVTVVCDLPHDGEIEGTETVSFAFDGTAYEIDVCSTHAKDLCARSSASTLSTLAVWRAARVAAAAAHAAVRAASAVQKFGHGPSSAATRSVSVAVFRPRSSRSTSPRTSCSSGRPAGDLRAGAQTATPPLVPSCGS